MVLPDSPQPANEGVVADDLVQNPAFLRKPNLRIRSDAEVLMMSLGAGMLVLLGALALQWIIYDRFLHQDGLRIVGSLISGAFATLLAHGMSLRTRHSRQLELRRLESIALMNHHIRNALQAIVCCSGSSESAEIIRESVNRIEWVLSDVLPGIDDEQKSSGMSADR
jgi:hypothetical protein